MYLMEFGIYICGIMIFMDAVGEYLTILTTLAFLCSSSMVDINLWKNTLRSFGRNFTRMMAAHRFPCVFGVRFGPFETLQHVLSADMLFEFTLWSIPRPSPGGNEEFAVVCRYHHHRKLRLPDPQVRRLANRLSGLLFRWWCHIRSVTSISS